MTIAMLVFHAVNVGHNTELLQSFGEIEGELARRSVIRILWSVSAVRAVIRYNPARLDKYFCFHVNVRRWPDFRDR